MPDLPFELPEYTLEPETISADGKEQTCTERRTENIGLSAQTQEAKANNIWNSAVWTRAILNQYDLEHYTSVANCANHLWVTGVWFKLPKAKFDRRLKEFLKTVTPEEQTQYEETRAKVLEIMKQAKEAHETKQPDRSSESEKSLVESVKARWRIASETAYEYTQIMDVLMSQAPEYVALTYGAVKILLVVQVNYEEMKQNIEEYMDSIKTKFSLIDHLTTYSPSAQLVGAVGRAYDGFKRFLAKALKFYTRSRFSMRTSYIASKSLALTGQGMLFEH